MLNPVVESAHCLPRRRATPATMSSSIRRVSARLRDGAGCAASCRAFRYSCGSASSRSRTDLDASRHARHTSATSRVLSFSGAMALASCSHSPRLARAIGTRCFIAAWGAMRPCWTSPCTSDGSSWTRASRRETQLGLRSNRSASSSWPKPWLSDSADSSHPCSRADSGAELRMDRASTSASASLRSHWVARTRS